MRKAQELILLDIVNKNLKKDGIGNAEFLEIKNNSVFAHWSKEKIEVGYLEGCDKEKNQVFIYRLKFKRLT